MFSIRSNNNKRRKAKKNKSEDSEECFTCLLKTIMLFGAFAGIKTKFKYCPHHSTRSILIYEGSSVRQFCLFLFTIAVFIAVVSHIFDLISMNEKVDIIYKLGIIMFEIDVFSVGICRILKTNERVKDLNGLASIISNKEKYGLDDDITILDKKYGQCLTNEMIVFITLDILITLLFFIHESIVQSSKLNYKFIYKSAVGTACIFSSMLFAFEVIVHLKIYTRLINACYQQIQKTIKDTFVQDEQVIQIVSQSQHHSATVIKRLKQLLTMHCAIMDNFKQTNRTYNPTILYLFVAQIFILILNIYLILTLWIDSATNSQYDILIVKQMETLAIFASVLWMLIHVERFTHHEIHILSFLEGIPFEKMSILEVAQIEILIMTIRTIQPKITGSNIFDVRISMLSTVSATIASYVLLAFQFQTSWI